MATIVPTLVDGDDFTDDFSLAVKAAADELQALAATSSTAITAAGVGGAIGTPVALRAPIEAGGAVVAIEFTVRNDKGSNLVNGDDLANLPAGFRPAANQGNVSAHVLNTNLAALVNISAAGLVEFSSGTVANGHFLRIRVLYMSP